MDFALYARVLSRFKLLVAFGLLLAASLALLSFVRITSDGLSYRQHELWSSSTRLIVTQQGFPWGRLLAQDPSLSEDAARSLGIPLADPNRLNNLTILYAELATTDPVRQLMRRDGPIRGKIIATPVVVQEGRYTLPLIDLISIATSPRAAVNLAMRSATAFETYLTDQQRLNKVPQDDRVIVQQVMRPREAEIYRPRSKTLPIVIFMAVMFAVVGLAFVLENVRPRRPQEPAAVVNESTARRTA